MGFKIKNKSRKAKNKSKNKPNSIMPSIDRDNDSEKDSDKIIKDARFASLHWDPRFQNVPKHKTKVVIDSRFNLMFNDKRFASSSAPSDKRGKPKKGNSQSSLRHYYHLEDEGGEEEKRKKDVVSIGDGTEESDDSEMSEKDSYGESEHEDERSESTQEENVPTFEKPTRRLAVVNCDWRFIKATDLYVMLSSIVPKDGQIISVSVYPTERGLKCMKEDIHGPVDLFDGEGDGEGGDDDDDEKLRAYEESRLSYYYAVVECDSIETADYLFENYDGIEIERTSITLNLEFIHDSVEFKHPPADVAVEQTKVKSCSWDEDEPQRAKILKRTFNDEQLEKLDLKEYLASDESGSDDDDENGDITKDQSDKKNKIRDRYRPTLLQPGDCSDGDGEEDDKKNKIRDMHMVAIFNPGLEDISKGIRKRNDKGAETVWEGNLRKRRERRKTRKNNSKGDEIDLEPTEDADDFFIEEPSLKRCKNERNQHEDTEKEAEASRAELELLFADDKRADTGLKGSNLKAKKAKGKKQKEALDVEKILVVDDDSRFAARFTSPSYALDPTNPQFKRSATYARQIAKKWQKGER